MNSEKNVAHYNEMSHAGKAIAIRDEAEHFELRIDGIMGCFRQRPCATMWSFSPTRRVRESWRACIFSGSRRTAKAANLAARWPILLRRKRRAYVITLELSQ